MSALKDSVKEFTAPTGEKPIRSVRTPKAIKQMCKRLSRLWRAHPQLKLGELVAGVFSDNYLKNLRLMGDGKLFEELEKFYGVDGDD